MKTHDPLTVQTALTVRGFQIDYTTRYPGYVWVIDGEPKIHVWYDDCDLHLDVTDRWLCPLYTLTFSGGTPLEVIEKVVDGMLTDDLGEDE